MKKLQLSILIIFLASVQFCFGQEVDSLLNLNLEALMNIEVTSVSKKAEQLKDVPASMYVITSADIERSGSKNFVDLLREYVPGFWSVANSAINSDIYIRNINTGSVLFLLDGTPLNDIVSQTLTRNNFYIPLAIIERIEVIKGSGGTVYGANSASGVVSIFTKDPEKGKKLFGQLSVLAPMGAEINLGTSKNFNDKLFASLYAGYKYFSGFRQMDVFENDRSVVPNSYHAGDTTITNRFTGDDGTYQTYNAGLNLKYKVSSKLTLSSRLHFNAINYKRYYSFYPSNKAYLAFYQPTQQLVPQVKDSLYLIDNNPNRIIGNIRADYQFSENHSLFVRLSTNKEHVRQPTMGSFMTDIAIYDLELQDNFEIPYNILSVGANIRLVHFDIHDSYDPGSVSFIDPQNNERLTGLFIQDKIPLLNDKLNFYLGIKTENFSLINNKYYLSPMAKVVVKPNDKITFWGGVTQGYTTPGYSNTNIEINIFRAKSPDVFFNATKPLVYQATYQTVYGQYVQAGLPAAQATAQTQAFMASAQGVATVTAETNKQIAAQATAFPNYFNISAINGKKTVPTAFTNYEAGLRITFGENFLFETNFYFSSFVDGILNSPFPAQVQPSLTRNGENIQPYFYGNYIKGKNYGLETVLKYKPIKTLNVEISHSWYKYDIQYQENNDFDIKKLTATQSNLMAETNPMIPEHIIRAKIFIDLPANFRMNVTGLYSTGFYNKFGTVLPYYEYCNQRYEPIFGNYIAPNKFKLAEHSNRTLLNFKLEKFFKDNNLSVYVYGSDVLSAPFVESINQLATVHPMQIGRVFGLGFNYSIN